MNGSSGRGGLLHGSTSGVSGVIGSVQELARIARLAALVTGKESAGTHRSGIAAVHLEELISFAHDSLNYVV